MELKATEDVEIIVDSGRLLEVVVLALKCSSVGVDLESNGFYHYPEQVCLIQLAFSGGIYLIDPLSLDDMAAFGQLLDDEGTEKVFHSSAYDIRSLSRDWKFRVKSLFDTSVAAAFLGSERLGLSSVLEEYLRIKILKDKKLQRANWTVRPIHSNLIKYATLDVKYLVQLAKDLRCKLSVLGRLDWVYEESSRITENVYVPSDSEFDFLSIKGRHKLDLLNLSVLRSLHKFRENEARRRNRPPFKILSDATLIELSLNPNSDFSEIEGIGLYGRGSSLSRVRDIVNNALNGPVLVLPKASQQRDHRSRIKGLENSKFRLRSLKEWRVEQSRRFAFTPSLAWPTVSLQRLAKNPSGFDEEISSAEVRRWQCREFADSLKDFLTTSNDFPNII